jgi:CBS domain containing-hemolysin-like protein
MGGFVIEVLDKLPQQGDVVELPGAVITVERVDKNRIESLRVILTDNEKTNEAEENAEASENPEDMAQ